LEISIFPTKILLATDGSKDAALAATAAVDLSKRTGARVHADFERLVGPTDADFADPRARRQVSAREGLRQ
jgi:nucleotide-binding universal stress UspA family protein